MFANSYGYLFCLLLVKRHPSEFLVKQRVKTNEQLAKSRVTRKNSEQRAKSNERQTKNNEQRAKTNKQRATSKKFHLSNSIKISQNNVIFSYFINLYEYWSNFQSCYETKKSSMEKITRLIFDELIMSARHMSDGQMYSFCLD